MNLNDRSCLSAPASITSWQKKESIDMGIPNGSHGCTPQLKEIGSHHRPVSPCASGEGLPYAPVDWPHPGDNWRWKVGKRVSNSGFYHDRYLYIPSRLQKPKCKHQGFSGKVSVQQYLRTEFPGADIDAFFASFSWKVPAKKQYWTKAEAVPKNGVEEIPRTIRRKRKQKPAAISAEAVPKSEVEEIPRTIRRKRKQKPAAISAEAVPKSEVEVISRTIRRKRKQKPAAVSAIFKRRTRHSQRLLPFTTKDIGVTIDLTEETDWDWKSTTDFESDHVSSRHISISPAGSFVATCPSPVSCRSTMDTPPESPAEVIIEDFDNYLNSLEDILAQSSSQAPSTPPATNDSLNLENEMVEARTKLSSLLAMDFSLLVSTKNLTELTVLSSKLRKDPGLTADQLLKLKLIEEIPLIGKDFLETKQTIEQADKFLADHEANIGKATSLRKEYNESKEKVARLQDEIDSSSSAIREIDDQIAKLQSQRAELISAVEFEEMLKLELNSALKMAVDSLPSVVRKVQLANSQKPEWELKKINSAKREDEILARYAPLKGFSL